MCERFHINFEVSPAHRIFSYSLLFHFKVVLLQSMEYNTQKKPLIIPEYGRNIHTMIEYSRSIEDREERNKFTEAIIDVMENINPGSKAEEDYKHKLWDQLYIMADYDLDVDAPYPMPDREEFMKRPSKPPYRRELRRDRYYGRIVQEMIEEVIPWEEGDRKDLAVLSIANQMKKNYINWNKDFVDNEQIVKDLNKLSGDKLTVKNPDDLVSDVAKINTHSKSNRKGKRKKKSRN